MKRRSLSSKSKSSAKQKRERKDASPDPNRALLLDAIYDANIERLRTVLENICTANPEAYAIASSELLVELVDATSSSLGSESNDTDTDAGTAKKNKASVSSGNSKRKRLYQRYETCEQCEEEYDVGENDSDACEYHSGELDVDSDADIWADHDYRCHGPYDTEENRKGHPEGFVWSCCEGDGDAPGCETDVHRPEKRKRRRY